jgi:hypothetical protein
MKNLFTLITLLTLIAGSIFSQVPLKMSYQAVVRNNNNQLITNQPIGVRISILQGSPGGMVVYTETLNPSTNANGLVTFEFGGVNLGNVNWAAGPYFIQSEVDPSGGTNYTINGTSQFLSVPFALHAKTAELVNETDPQFLVSPAAGISSGNISNWNSSFAWGNHALAGYLTTETDGSITNEIQTLGIENDRITLSNGGSVQLPDAVSSISIIDDYLYANYRQGSSVNIGYIGRGAPGSTMATVATSAATHINYTSALIDANVTTNGGEFVMSRGICLSSMPSPTLNNTCFLSGSGTGIYSTHLDNLVPNTTYYIRAFATNAIGTSYGNELSFTTLPQKVPVLATNAIYNISHTTAISGGSITDGGGLPIQERGICWSLTSGPTLLDGKNIQTTEQANYNAQLSGLTPNTFYYVRAYATNALGTGYGNEITFTTATLSLASITTNGVINISYTSATSGGNVTSDNGSSVTSRGICWATSPMPTTANSVYSEAGAVGNFNANMTGLTPATTYYVRAFAINGAGTVYGNQQTFTTPALTAPVLTTKTISGISSNIAGSGGTITSDGGSAITAKGVCWGLNPVPTIAGNKTNEGGGSASYNSTMTGLTPLTTYYVRAYATNAIGTTYGNEITFTTTDLVYPGPSAPTIGTSTPAMTGSTTASCGGYISADGGSEITVRGVCWSTTQNPTLADNHSEDGTGIGYFSSTVSGLSGCGTVVYIRAYATNSTGTAYGNQVSVSTGLLPAVATDEVSNIDFYTAVCGGNVVDDGGCSITQKGICWNYSPNPTISNFHTTEGAGGGTFVSNITGLYANRTYYVRSYATNSVGTVYGPEKVFTTATPSTPYIGQNYAGGIVFYVDETGLHGLVCAPSDQGNASWGCQGTDIATGNAIGTGAVNTAAIVAGCTTPGIAAKICDDLVLNGYSDWYLPSVDELGLMYSNLYLKSIGNFDAYGSYWSSSQANASEAWYCHFNNGFQWHQEKRYSNQFRAIRAF